jgi:hypothetical protein
MNSVLVVYDVHQWSISPSRGDVAEPTALAEQGND